MVVYYTRMKSDQKNTDSNPGHDAVIGIEKSVTPKDGTAKKSRTTI